MTINAGTPRISYTAAGATDFIFDFPIWAKTDVKVYANEVLQTVDTDYTVTFTAGSESGGTVSFVSAPTAGFIIEIVRRLTEERDSDFPTSGPFSMGTLNKQLDQLTAQGQDQTDEIDRALHLPANTTGADAELPEPVGGEMWRWALDGASVEAFDTSDLETVVQASQMIRDTYVDGVDYTAGVTTELTLTRNPGTEGNTEVHFDGVYQSKTVYAVSGTTITFADPITAGVSLVEIMQIQAAEPQSVSTATTLQFDTSPGAISNVEGLLWWNETSKTLNIGLEGDVTMQVGQEIPLYVKNESGSAVNDGDMVYVSGSTGVHLVVGLADASDLAKSSQVGMVTTPAGISNNGFGFVTRFGAVRGLDASGSPVSESWNDGDLLYLSATTPGTLSTSAPGTPHFTVEVGIVVNNNGSVGVLGIDPKQPHAANVALGTSDLVGPTQGAVKSYVDASDFRKVLYKDTTQSNHTGDTDETTLMTYTLPGGTLSATGAVSITAVYSALSNASNSTFKLYFGTDVVATITVPSGDIHYGRSLADVINKTASTQTQGLTNFLTAATSFTPAEYFVNNGSSSEDTAAGVVIKMTGQLGNGADTISGIHFIVEQVDA